MNRALSGATIPGLRGLGSNGIERVLCIPQSPSITIRLFSTISRTLIMGRPTPLPRWCWCILRPQPTGQVIAWGRIIGLIPFPRVFVVCEMQSTSCRIGTRVAMSISSDDGYYTMSTPNCTPINRWKDIYKYICLKNIYEHHLFNE